MVTVLASLRIWLFILFFFLCLSFSPQLCLILTLCAVFWVSENAFFSKRQSQSLLSVKQMHPSTCMWCRWECKIWSIRFSLQTSKIKTKKSKFKYCFVSVMHSYVRKYHRVYSYLQKPWIQNIKLVKTTEKKPRSIFKHLGWKLTVVAFHRSKYVTGMNFHICRSAVTWGSVNTDVVRCFQS